MLVEKIRWKSCKDSVCGSLLATLAFSLFAQHGAVAQTANPGTGATINIQARVADGSIPTNVQVRISPVIAQNAPNWPMGPVPDIVGSNGDWVATNVSPGIWQVNLESTNYLPNPRAQGFNRPWNNSLLVTIGETYSLSFTFSKGLSFTGRVVDSETDLPIAGVSVNGALTDADGRYHVEHQVGTLTARSTNYVQQQKIYRPATPAAGNLQTQNGAVLPVDFKLQRGGWIAGQVVLPAGAPEGAIPQIALKKSSAGLYPPPNPEFGPSNTFRVGPLPPGSYQLDVSVTSPQVVKGGPRNPWHAQGQMTSIGVKAWQVTSNIVVETK